jgi:23S rRNA pseudouridine1911/1915/1917 synthase
MADDTSNSGEQSLLDWAMRLCPDSPRKRVKDWLTAGRFYLNGKVVTQANVKMPDPGEALTLGPPDSSIASWAHRKKIHPKLSVLHLDESLAIVDKGAGLLSVPVEGHGAISALDVLGNYLNDPKGDTLRRRLFGSAAKVRPLPVHRLDQYTSGLLCLALNAEARSMLIDQLRSHELLREYLAFADGRARSDSGTWRHYLRLDRTGYRQSLFDNPVEGSVEAVTHFSVDHIFQRHRVTKLKIQLETGMKHQIRIQASAEGLPLIGDRVYHAGTRKAMERKGATLPYGFKRQALHATIIGLKHPKTGRDMRFESHPPMDMVRLEQRLD